MRLRYRQHHRAPIRGQPAGWWFVGVAMAWDNPLTNTAALALPPHIGNYQKTTCHACAPRWADHDTALQLMGLDMDSRDDALAAADQP